VIAQVAEAGPADVDAAVAQARAAFDDGAWAGLPGGQRARILWRVADLIEEHADELARLETRDQGQPLNISAGFSVPMAAEVFRYYAGWCTKIEGTAGPVATPDVLHYTRREPVGVAAPIIEHQNVGTILVDMKARLEAARYLTWKACDYFDRTGGAGTEIAVLTKIFSSEAAVQVVYDAMRLVGIESYTDTQPFADLLRDALAYPLFDGGNVGVRRPYLQALFAMPGYDPLAAADNRPQPN
jgi:hypothetical protein